jgi:hypothetical protein
MRNSARIHESCVEQRLAKGAIDIDKTKGIVLNRETTVWFSDIVLDRSQIDISLTMCFVMTRILQTICGYGRDNVSEPTARTMKIIRSKQANCVNYKATRMNASVMSCLHCTGKENV